MCVCMYICMHVYVCMYVCVYVCMCVYVYVCVCVCVYVCVVYDVKIIYRMYGILSRNKKYLCRVLFSSPYFLAAISEI